MFHDKDLNWQVVSTRMMIISQFQAPGAFSVLMIQRIIAGSDHTHMGGVMGLLLPSVQHN